MSLSAETEPPLLEMRGVGKHYRGVAALKDIDFDVRRGEVHAILGENGAGKSTLVKIMAGAVTPTQGEIRIEGQRIQIASPSLARRYGIAMVYQETSLVPSMTWRRTSILATKNSSTACAAPILTPSNSYSR